MLVETYDHRLPQLDASTPTVYSSLTSTSIPPLSETFVSTHTVHRLQRRARAAPYQIPNATRIASSSANTYQPSPHVHAPQPIQYQSPVQALDEASSTVGPTTPQQTACAGAHGTILGPFSPRPDCEFGNPPGELTATQMCAADAAAGGEYTISPEETTSFYSTHTSTVTQVPIIKMPKVPKIPHVSSVQVSPIDQPSSSSTAAHPASELQAHPPNKFPPAQNTFPTPSELLSELTQREQGTASDARRAKRRKTPLDDYTCSNGFVPTDPDTISSHDKKRFYLDCLEQYILYLHSQLRLVGVEPVPIERVSSGRGLTSRSIRTMIVHMQKMATKLHEQKNEAARNYDKLLGRLGSDADKVAPSFTTGSFCEGAVLYGDSTRDVNSGSALF